MTAAVRPNPGARAQVAVTRDMINANPEAYHEFLTTLVVASLNSIYVPFNPQVNHVTIRKTGITLYRDEKWQSVMVDRANAKMKKLFPAISTAKGLSKSEQMLYAKWVKAIKERIVNNEPLLNQVIHDPKTMSQLSIKDINHVILGFLVRLTRTTAEAQSKEIKMPQAIQVK